MLESAADEETKAAFQALARQVRRGAIPAVEAQLETFRRRTAGGPWEHRAAYLLGRLAFRSERYAKSIAFFARVARRYPLLRDYAEYNMARAFARQGLFAPAIRHLRRIRQQFPDSRLQARVRLSLGESFLEIGAVDRAVATLEELLASHPHNEQSVTVLRRLAAIYEQRGRHRNAARRLVRLYLEFPTQGDSEEDYRRLVELSRRLAAPVLPLSAEALAQRAARLEAGNAWRPAAETWRRVAERAGDPTLRGNAALRLAMSLKFLGEPQAARQVLDQFTARAPEHPDAPEATYRLAQLLWRRPTYRRAHRLFTKLQEQYPEDPWAARALYALGQLAEGRRRATDAIGYYRRLIKRFDEAPDRAEATWRIGWLHYRAHRFKQAAETFAGQLRNSSPDAWRPAARYWLGRSYERLGKRRQALDLYTRLLSADPVSYYSRSAALRLAGRQDGKALGRNAQPLSDGIPLHRSVLALSRLPEQDTLRARIARANELALLELTEDAQAEIDAIERQLDDKPAHRFLIGLLRYDAGATLKAFGVFSSILGNFDESGRKALPREFWQAYFPVSYRTEVAKAARRLKLDELLLLSIIRQESAFDADSLSSANAMGLMQVLPQTGRQLLQRRAVTVNAGTFRANTFRAEDLYDPALNIQLGSRYVANLLRRFNNSLPLVLAAYNAGPGAVRRWRERFGDQPMEEFIENIPYRETRGYVKRVLRNYHIYQQLYRRSGKS